MMVHDVAYADRMLTAVYDLPEETIINLMPFVSEHVKLWLFNRPNLAYLRDDMLSEGYMTIVRLVNSKVREEELEGGVQHHLSGAFIRAALQNCFVDVRRSEMTIKFPKGRERFHPQRENSVPDVINSRDHYEQIGEILDTLSLTDEERLIVNLRVAGHTLMWIQDTHEIVNFRAKVEKLRVELIRQLGWNLLEKDDDELTST